MNISGAPANLTPTFKWCVSGGTIVSGQGTSAVVIDASEVKEDYVTVVVMVGGFDKVFRACELLDAYDMDLSEGAAPSQADSTGACGASAR